MATPQLSPGVIVREVDLTVGRAENVLDNIGAIAGPFQLGPVEEPTTISTQQELLNVFGQALSTDRQYEYWYTASEFLTYGGVLSVVRSDGASLNNSNAGVGIGSTNAAKIKNYDDYQQNYSSATNFTYASKFPGRWANSLKVCTIDNAADQTIGITTNNLASVGALVGYGVTVKLANKAIPGAGTTSAFNGHLKGIITGVSTDAINSASTFDVKILSRVSQTTTQDNTTLETTSSSFQIVGAALTVFVDSTSGINVNDKITISGISTAKLPLASIGSTSVVLSGSVGYDVSAGLAVTFVREVSVGGTETQIDYNRGSDVASISASDTVAFFNNSGTFVNSQAVSTVEDWYDSQTLNLTNSTIFWKNVAPKPVDSNYVSTRSGRNDGIHIVVVDDTGSISGIQGNILERNLSLSKAKDGEIDGDVPTKSYYKDFIANNSTYLYAGYNPSAANDDFFNTKPVAGGFSTSFTPNTISQGLWSQNAQGVTFSALGNNTYTLNGGEDYNTGGGFTASLGDLQTAYNLFSNRDDVSVDFLMMGPGLGTELETQAKANLLISIAEGRKDCMATISPHRSNVVNVTNTTTQTNNVLNYYSSLSSSSFAVFDSGYKYMYDRFNNEFRYIPLNGDIAGTMVRTNINSFPWFSPAGAQRGQINNAIKLAYNPNKTQRDSLYGSRINSVINQNGQGILLFGDKTALSYSSAFDRINVRRLFLTVEQALEGAANDQLFELNDSETRSNFVNIVEPYLRQVQAQRGIQDFLVVCDETNNTPDVIDNNEFRADIFLRPTRSINYVTLTFVATRTGISFEEVVGTV